MALLVTKADIDAIIERHRAELMDLLLRNIEAGYREVAAGTESEHPRAYLRSLSDPRRRPPGLFSMSALLGEAGLMGTRLLALGGDRATEGDGLLILFDQQTKKCLAIVWDQSLHNYRSGAPAGVAAARLAPPEPAEAAVIGSSGIAEGTLAILHHVRPSLRHVRVFSPTPAHRERFAERMRGLLGIDVVAVADAETAVRNAELIVTATDADRPVVPDAAVRPGAFIAAMARNEVAQETLRRSNVVLSSVAATEALDPPFREPFPPETLLGDLGGVAGGTVRAAYDPGRPSVFGGCAPQAMWDVAAAAAVHELARARGLGKEMSLYG